MNIIFFIMICITILLLLLIIKKHKLLIFFKQKNSKYYLCWIVMLLSNLAFPKSIQYTTRFLGLFITWIIILLSTKNESKRFHLNIIKLVLLISIFFYFISTIYSISKLETFMKCVEVFTDFILIYIISEKDKDKYISNTLNVTVHTIFVTVLITVVGFFVIPAYFTENGYTVLHSLLGTRLSNGFLGANKTSALAVLCIIWIFFTKKKIRLYDLFMLIVCSIAMFYSQSRTTLLLIPIILFLRFFKPKSRYKIFYFIIIMFLICIGFNYIDRIETYILRGQSQEMLISGTGRTEMWALANEYIALKPILGYGYGVGGEIVAEKYFNITSMHNAVYETLLGTGYVGLGLLILQFSLAIILFMNNIFKYRIKNNLLDILLMLFFIVRSVSSVGIAGWHSMELMIWYFIIFAISEKGKSIQMNYISIK